MFEREKSTKTRSGQTVGAEGQDKESEKKKGQDSDGGRVFVFPPRRFVGSVGRVEKGKRQVKKRKRVKKKWGKRKAMRKMRDVRTREKQRGKNTNARVWQTRRWSKEACVGFLIKRKHARVGAVATSGAAVGAHGSRYADQEPGACEGRPCLGCDKRVERATEAHRAWIIVDGAWAAPTLPESTVRYNVGMDATPEVEHKTGLAAPLRVL